MGMHEHNPRSPRATLVLLTTLALGAGCLLGPSQALAGPSVEAASLAPAEVEGQRFPSATLASYFRPGDTRVLVVGAGPLSEPLTALTTQALTSLRATGRFELVIDQSALGELSSAGDQDIVERAAGQPVDAILILRVFGEGEQEAVVGSIYATDGAVISAFNLGAGAPLAPSADTATASGVSESTMDSISDVMHEDGSDRAEGELSEAEIAYIQRYVHFGVVISYNVYTGAGSVRPSDLVYRGTEDVPLKDVEFLEYIGEHDLARRHKTRSRLKLGLILSGSIAGPGLLVGGGVLFSDGTYCEEWQSEASCARYRSLGTAMMIAGGVLIPVAITGIAIPSVFKAKDRKRYVEAYNSRLRAELELSEDIEDQLRRKLSTNQRVERMLATWRVGPSLAGTGGGLSLSGQF